MEIAHRGGYFSARTFQIKKSFLNVQKFYAQSNNSKVVKKLYRNQCNRD